MHLSSRAVVAAILFVASATAQSTTSSADDVLSSLASNVNVANVPDCAKVCLSNSTQYATDCAQIDVKCLCNSPSYVSALSCCLSTSCNAEDQQTAIQFNIQECAAVNSTAPNFVGCSPFSITSGGSGGSKTSSVSTGSSSTGVITISGDHATLPAAFTDTKVGTATYTGAALLTGSCTVPLFAEVTNGDHVYLFPQVGCALNRGSCCPFDPTEYRGLTKCPVDYFSTASACCPRGFSVYSGGVGAETPCYSPASAAYVPATTVSGSDKQLITNAVFTRMFPLVSPPKAQLSSGEKAGIAVGVIAAAATPFFLIWILRGMKRRQAESSEEAEKQGEGATFPPTEPTLDTAHIISEAPPGTAVSELSPDTAANTPRAGKGLPFQSPSFRSVPPAYEVPAAIPVEMPGSTYMHEHHPVYTGSQTDLTPRTPPRSPAQSPSQTATTRSPVLSPSSPFRSDSPSNGNSFTITPLGSPRFQEHTM